MQVKYNNYVSSLQNILFYLREHNPDTSLKPSLKSAFSTSTSKYLSFDYHVRVTLKAWHKIKTK